MDVAGDNPITLRFDPHPSVLKSASHARRASAGREVGALSDLDNVPVRIGDVAENLALLFLRRPGNELGSSTVP